MGFVHLGKTLLHDMPRGSLIVAVRYIVVDISITPPQHNIEQNNQNYLEEDVQEYRITHNKNNITIIIIVVVVIIIIIIIVILNTTKLISTVSRQFFRITASTS